jgi:hypothetical protein
MIDPDRPAVQRAAIRKSVGSYPSSQNEEASLASSLSFFGGRNG